MRNYLAPDYKNEELMSSDVITASVASVTKNFGNVTGLTETIENEYDESGTFTGQTASYSYSINNFFN